MGETLMMRGSQLSEVLGEEKGLFQEEKDLWLHGGTKRSVYLHPPVEVSSGKG